MNRITKPNSITAVLITMPGLLVFFINPVRTGSFLIGFIVNLFLAAFVYLVSAPISESLEKWDAFVIHPEKVVSLKEVIIAAVVFVGCAIFILTGINNGWLRALVFLAMWGALCYAGEGIAARIWKHMNGTRIESDLKDPEYLIEVLRKINDDRRSQIFGKLVSFGDTAVPVLASVYKMDNQYQTQIQWAFTEIAKQDLQVILELALHEPDNKLRAAAFDIVKKSKTKIPLFLVEESLMSSDVHTRLAAVKILDHYGWEPPANENGVRYWMINKNWKKCRQIGNLAVPLLLAEMRNEESDNRIDAIQTLAKTGAAETVEPLLDLYRKETNEIKVAILQALGQIGDSRSFDTLLTGLQQSETCIQLAAIDSLGQLKDDSFVEPLLEALEDADSLQSVTIINALGQYKDTRVVELFQGMLIKPGNALSLSAAIVAALDGVAWQPADDESKAWYWAAKQEWQKCVQVGEAAIPALLQAMAQQSDIKTQDAIQTVLEEIGAGAIEVLLPALVYENSNVRKRVTAILARIGPDAVASLIGNLDHPEKYRRIGAATVLGMMRTNQALPVLQGLVEDEDSGAVARWAIAKIESSDTLPDLQLVGVDPWTITDPPSEENELKRQQRIQAQPDPKLLMMLKSGNQMGLKMALSNITPEALAALEETIALYSGNPDLTFYRLGGLRTHTDDSIQSAKETILDLALDGALLKDPAFSQSLIAGLGISAGVSELVMRQLAINPQWLYEYQLLGVQMQLAHLVNQSSGNHMPAEKEVSISGAEETKQKLGVPQDQEPAMVDFRSIAVQQPPGVPFIFSRNGRAQVIVRIEHCSAGEMAQLKKAVQADRILLAPLLAKTSFGPVLGLKFDITDDSTNPYTVEAISNINLVEVMEFTHAVCDMGEGDFCLYAGTAADLVTIGRFVLRIPPFYGTSFPYSSTAADKDGFLDLLNQASEDLQSIPESKRDFRAAAQLYLANSAL